MACGKGTSEARQAQFDLKEHALEGLSHTAGNWDVTTMVGSAIMVRCI